MKRVCSAYGVLRWGMLILFGLFSSATASGVAGVPLPSQAQGQPLSESAVSIMSGAVLIRASAANQTGTTMQITIRTDQVTLVYDLNESQAARELYAQLPMDIAVENYGGIEKIFYPPQKLGTTDTPLAKDVRSGTLAYYAPWGDVVMFYDSFGSAAGLYELGSIVSGREAIEHLSGTIRIEKSDSR
ncbi:cyclophilin-like fold protein [Paracoccus sp. MBLB3053]|uniref:Cyclophilin-like fold protein n=1 Tax=Paracoccus aurantius TaxID=3073814 RepID=A0ABU2HR08_9RHOB|nr:cyclophilin-like fold protein [Paracoccus sp. MBLB3053]MDS9467485.1 cyclophilin-like fold protein [Paracoccus sp. MBLB3053]